MNRKSGVHAVAITTEVIWSFQEWSDCRVVHNIYHICSWYSIQRNGQEILFFYLANRQH